MRAPVSLSVEFVLSVMLTLPDDMSAAKMVFSTPRPPATFKAPVIVSVASTLFVTVTLSASTFSRLASVA